jgi:pyruvate kinase
MFNPFAGGTGAYKAPSDLISRTVKTKAMCTLGPACVSKRDVARLLVAGMNVARFNASHGTHAQWQQAVDTVRAACSETGVHCALLLDIRGYTLVHHTYIT